MKPTSYRRRKIRRRVLWWWGGGGWFFLAWFIILLPPLQFCVVTLHVPQFVTFLTESMITLEVLKTYWKIIVRSWMVTVIVEISIGCNAEETHIQVHLQGFSSPFQVVKGGWWRRKDIMILILLIDFLVYFFWQKTILPLIKTHEIPQLPFLKIIFT